MRGRYGAEVELVEGSGGVFKVWADGRLIWDKKAMGGFPDEEEVVRGLGE